MEEVGLIVIIMFNNLSNFSIKNHSKNMIRNNNKKLINSINKVLIPNHNHKLYNNKYLKTINSKISSNFKINLAIVIIIYFTPISLSIHLNKLNKIHNKIQN